MGSINIHTPPLKNHTGPVYIVFSQPGTWHRLIRTHSGFPGVGILAADIRRAAGNGR